MEKSFGEKPCRVIHVSKSFRFNNEPAKLNFGGDTLIRSATL